MDIALKPRRENLTPMHTRRPVLGQNGPQGARINKHKKGVVFERDKSAQVNESSSVGTEIVATVAPPQHPDVLVFGKFDHGPLALNYKQVVNGVALDHAELDKVLEGFCVAGVLFEIGVHDESSLLLWRLLFDGAVFFHLNLLAFVRVSLEVRVGQQIN